MKRSHFSRIGSLFLSYAILISPLPLSAIAEEIILNISEFETEIIARDLDTSYVYLGKELSNIADLISRLSILDNNKNSAIHNLKNHIDEGYSVAQYDDVLNTVKYAELFLQKNRNKLTNVRLKKIIRDLEKIVDQIINGSLNIHIQSSRLKNSIPTAYATKANGTKSPPNTMTVQGLLSVNDEIVQNIMAVNLSVTDQVISEAIELLDVAGTAYVGIQAPVTVPTSYTVSLPSAVPTVGQTLQAGSSTPTNLAWVTPGGSVLPAASETIYVTKYGNDTTGNGSFNSPYASLAKAINAANGIASNSNPVAIVISSGIYTENNSAGPLEITIAGVSIVGESASSVIIMPNTPANNLLLIDNTVRIAEVTFESSSPVATGLSLAAGVLSVFSNVRFVNFLIGINCAGGTAQSYGFNTCFFVNNGTAININNTRVECNSCTIFGTSSLGGPAANSGISATGAEADLVFSGGVIGLCTTGMNFTDNAVATVGNVAFRLNDFDIVQNSSAYMALSGASFELTNSSSDIDIQVIGAGTMAEIIGCEFNGTSLLGVTQGTSIAVTGGGTAYISGGTMHDYTTGIQAGASSDTSSTFINASSLIIHDCTTDILQQGTATLNVNGCTISSSAITVNDTTNVNLAFFDLDNNNALNIGSTANQDTTLLEAAVVPGDNPIIEYLPSLYSTQAIGLANPASNPSSWFVTADAAVDLTAITQNRTQTAGIRLVSDTASPLGGTTALRGWDINKNGSVAQLSFNYQNSDLVGQTAVSEYTVMQLDGFNNLLQLPTAGTQIVFDTDTNLYRSSANVLKTDDNFIVGTLTPARAVITDPTTNQLESSVTTSTELSYLSGTTSSVQTQLNGKVAKAGDIMTGTLQLPAGTAASPSLAFTGSITTGLSASTANTLSFDISGTEQMNISATGVTIDGFTTAGVVHNSAAGLLTSSLIVDADITTATITNDKLANISSSNVSGDIVVRDGSGNFATNMVTLFGTTTLATDAATKAYVDAVVSLGIVAHTPALVVSVTDIGSPPTGLLTIDGVTLVANDRVLLVGQTNQVYNGIWLAQSGAWTYPTDFALGTEAGQAYVLITSGADYEGSSWLCNTPTAIIGTDPITFAEFSIPSATTGANVGTGTGLVFQSKSGITLNFRSLLAGTHLTITNNANDITFTTDATNSNTASTIVARDASGNFSAGTITASLIGGASLDLPLAGGTMTGNLTLPTGTVLAPSLNFTGSTTTGLSAPATNTLSVDINGVEQMNISSTGVLIDSLAGSAGVVHNDALGNLTSSLIVNTDVSASAAIVDTKLATIMTAGKVANSATTATSLDTTNSIVLRDSSGNFAAGTITANLTGSASLDLPLAGGTMTGTLQLAAGTTSAPSLVFTGSTTTGLSANMGALSFSTDGAEQLAISSGGTVSIDAFITAGVVHNDASGNLSTSLIVDADVSATAAIIDTKLATIVTAGKVANSATTATSADTASTIVLRDASGDFSAGTITATLNGNATTATNFTGSLTGDVTGTQSATVVSFVGGQTAAAVAAATILANTATNLDTANTIVLRDGTGSFAAQVISMTDGVHSGNLILTTEPSSSTAGNILKGSNSFIHDFGINNTFVGIDSGNFTMTSTGNNSAFGGSTLTANTTGANNTALGYQGLTANTVGNDNTAVGYNALVANVTGSSNIAIGYEAGQSLTTGSGNIYVDADAGAVSESSTIRIGTAQTSCFIAGITGIGLSGDGVVVDSNGQLGITLSSQRFKHNIHDIESQSASIFKLRPVTFAYNNDATETQQFGLIAEEVEAVFPEIVARDENNVPYTVRYQMLPILLLNELQKQHHVIEAQQITIEKMNTAISNLQSKIQQFINETQDVKVYAS